MDKNKFESILILIVPDVIKMIAQHYSLSEIEASNLFYNSAVYEKLEHEETKLWHLSPKALFEIFKGEHENGVVEFPEEA